MHGTARRAERNEREEFAAKMPHRRGFENPLDERLESPLGRLRVKNQISEAEYQAGNRFREFYLAYLMSIGCPTPYGGIEIELSDAVCAAARESFERAKSILAPLGRGVFHSVLALVVYQELVDHEEDFIRIDLAKRGLRALAGG
jgi:hypothetical protein